MEKLMQIILNDFIPKAKVKSFLELVTEYGFSSLKYFIHEKENKVNRYKIPIEELRKRLTSKINKIEEPNLEINDISDKTEVLNKCDDMVNKIIYDNKKSKKYYYHLGKYLSLLKSHFVLNNTVDNFNKFIDERYKIKLSTLYKYIKFYLLCEKYPDLYNCDLTLSEIMDNVPEIKSLFL